MFCLRPPRLDHFRLELVLLVSRTTTLSQDFIRPGSPPFRSIHYMVSHQSWMGRKGSLPSCRYPFERILPHKPHQYLPRGQFPFIIHTGKIPVLKIRSPRVPLKDPAEVNTCNQVERIGPIPACRESLHLSSRTALENTNLLCLTRTG